MRTWARTAGSGAALPSAQPLSAAVPEPRQDQSVAAGVYAIDRLHVRSNPVSFAGGGTFDSPFGFLQRRKKEFLCNRRSAIDG